MILIVVQQTSSIKNHFVALAINEKKNYLYLFYVMDKFLALNIKYKYEFVSKNMSGYIVI